MAVSVPASPFVVSYFTTEPGQSMLFPDDSKSIGLYTSFGEDDSNTSFGSWPDPYSCGEVSSFPSADSFSSLLNSPAASLLCEDDLNLAAGASASELLEHFGCHVNTPVMMHANLVETPKDTMTSDELYIAEENMYGPREDAEMQQCAGGSQLSDEDSTGGSFEEGGIARVDVPGDCFRVCNDDESVEEEEPVDGVHIPPPLNMKRIEMYDDAYYESIEAAEVPLDVIENKRPFQCGLAGCDKTFKNPQTMKMHHKTHFSDGSAALDDLPTLTWTPGSGGGGGGGSAASWMAGRSKKIPSRCPKCRKTFVGLYELRRHYGRKHSEGERPFQCRKCDKRFYIEVDVRDHEKLCGEQIECKCGLKFAFKCNMVAHKKAHPECRDLVHPNNSTSVTIMNSANNSANNSTNNLANNPAQKLGNNNSTSVTIMNSSSINAGYQATISEDSSRSRWISSGAPSRAPGTKRCHELVEESRPDLMSKLTKVYSRRSSPAQNFPGLGPQEDAASAGFDFSGLGDGSSLWGSPSTHFSNLPWPVPVVPEPALTTSVFGGLDQFARRGVPGKLGALDLLHLAGVTPGLRSLQCPLP